MRRGSHANRYMNAVDTNVLLYASDPRDARRQAIAVDLLATLTDCVLLWQVACEYAAASRKLVPFGFSANAALSHINGLTRIWSVQTPSWQSLDCVSELMSSRSLSFWDALIVAACLETGVDKLYTEDFQAGMRIGSILIVNPFLK